jgi:hypothetical protein
LWTFVQTTGRPCCTASFIRWISVVCFSSSVWQFMQTLADGMPACRLVRAPEWQ